MARAGVATPVTDTLIRGALTAETVGRKLSPISVAETGAGLTDADLSHHLPYGDLRRYKMTGVGDETAKLLNAIAACAAGDYTLKGEPGKTYTITTAAAIDLSGVRKLNLHGCTLDCSASTAAILFQATGSKTIVKSAVSLANGAGIIDVTGSGETFERGDTILVTSIEAHPNPARAEYFKGSRTYVDSQVGNDLRVYPQIDHQYTASAYVWKITENEIRWHGGRIIGNDAVNQAGLVCDLCVCDIALDVDYCAQAGVRFESSRGRFTGTMRYCYLGASGTSYCVSVADLSDIAIHDAHLTGSRHAVAIGGGTWQQTDSGGVAGQAAYPASATINGGTYGSSRSGTAFPADPSYEIGAIDCHGIAKNLVVSGAIVHGGFQLAAIESCVIDGNTVYAHNYKIVGIADSLSYDWGHIKFVNNDCHFVGDHEPLATPAAEPKFINAGSAERGRHLEVRGNTFHVPASLTGSGSIGLIRGFREIDFCDNRLRLELATADVDFEMDIWVKDVARLSGNRTSGVSLRLYPVDQAAIVKARANQVGEAGATGIQALNNPLDATAYFRELHFDDNLTHSNYEGGIRVRADVVKRLYALNNCAVNNNVSGGAVAYISAGFAIQKINDNDIIDLFVAKGNVAISDADAAFAHTRGIYIATGANINTDVIVQGNVSRGHSADAMNNPDVAGATIIHMDGNTDRTDRIRATNGTFYEFNGVAWVAA